MAKVSGSASTDIDAPRDAVWAVVQDVERWVEWQGTLGVVTPAGDDGAGRVATCHVHIDAGPTTLRVTLACSYSEPEQMRFASTSGDLKSLTGGWQLDALDGARTRVTYELEAEAGGMLGMLLSDDIAAKLRQRLVDVRPGELKARVEG